MKKRLFLFDDGEQFIIWSEHENGVELICVKGDTVYYYVPNKLPDMILFTQLMERMHISENDRNNIRNIVIEMYDDWKKSLNK